MKSLDVITAVFFQNLREMLLIAGDQVVRTGSVGALQKYVVVGIACDVKCSGRLHEMTAAFDELQ